MWRKSDGAPEAGEASLFLEMAQDGPVRLPESFPLAASRFERVGTDLQLTGPEGEHAVVRDYFLNGEAADLVSPAGARFPGQLVTELAGPLSPAQVAAAGRGVVAEAIGKVDNITGNATAIRADGTHVELEAGDPVYQGDVLTTGPEGAIGIVLADDTSFAMSQNGRMVLDELIYDPGTQEGSIALSVVQGLFAFVSGQIAKMNPEAMTVETPVATIGIRGTQMGREIPDGQNLQVVLMEELDAFVGEVIVRNKAGLVVLNEANQFTVVSDFGLPPNAIQVISLGDLVDRFSGPLSHLPIHQGTENTYGVDSTVPGGFDSLDSFDTAAGGDGSVVGGTDDGTGQGGGDQTINVVGDDYTGTPDRLDGDIGGGFGVPGRGGDLGASTPQGLNGNDQFAGLATGAVGATGGQLVDGVWTQSVSGFYDGSGRIEPQNILGGGGNDTIIAGPGNDRVEGLGGDDVIEGRGGDDVLIGTDGDDIIYGGDGDDTIIGGTGAGDDLYDGQAGNDTAAYGSTGLGVIVDLAAGTASGEEIDDDRLISIENAIGGGGGDIIVGNDGANRLDGGAGNDILAGGAMATTGSPAARASTRPSMPVPTPTIWSPLTGRSSSYPAPKASTA